MKKLLLVTGIFLSLGFMASAQQKKTAIPAPATQTTTPQKKKTIKDMKTEKTQAKLRKAEAKQKVKTAPPAGSRETQTSN